MLSKGTFVAALGAAVVPLALGAVSPAAADGVGDFYKGKRATIFVGSAAGGGYDAYARLVARHMGRYVPGNPSIIVQNMPGGGGLTATNYLYNIAAKDGSAMGVVQRALTIAPLINPQGVKYDTRKFNWLGSINSETGVVAVWHTAPQKSIQDVMKTELLVGGSGPYNDTEIFPRVYNKTLGTKFRIVSGYKSTGPVLLAMERGEVQGIGDSSWSNWKTSYAHYLKNKEVRIILQSGLEKNKDLPDVPMALDLAKSEADRQVMELLLTPKTIGRPFVAPPDVPADRVKALRAAFMEMTRDAKFLSEAERQKMEIDPLSGEYVQKTLQRLFHTPEDVVAAARDAIKPGK